MCNYHFQPEIWDIIQTKNAPNFTSKAVDEMVFLLLNLSPNVQLVEIGLTNEQFEQVLFELEIPDDAKSMISATRLYIERLRHGHTYEQMSHRHNITRKTIAKFINRGRNLLLNDFVPRNLGFECHDRQWLLDHTTDLARMLYCNNDPTKSVTICDGTYIYTCGSSNYEHQRNIYSSQKRRHLFKIMKIVTVDGSIIDTFGPFSAKTNDAPILKDIFEKTSIEKIFRAGDVMLLDRGFRDCVRFLRTKNLDVRLPKFMNKASRNQLTTIEDNKSRFVTKMRFAIEAANGRMKSKWHLFGKIIPSILTPPKKITFEFT